MEYKLPDFQEKSVISLRDVDSIYKIPALLKAQGLDEICVKRFGLNCPEADLSEWEQVVSEEANTSNEVVIGLKDKDKFNASRPSGDGQFLDYVTNPTLPALLSNTSLKIWVLLRLLKSFPKNSPILQRFVRTFV